VVVVPAVDTENVQVGPDVTPDGEAYFELVRLLEELVQSQGRRGPRPAEIEAVIALAGLVRGERGLDGVDPQEDPGPEELRVQGARRFASWLDDVGESRGKYEDLVTAWLKGAVAPAVREDDPAPVVKEPKAECAVCAGPVVTRNGVTMHAVGSVDLNHRARVERGQQ